MRRHRILTAAVIIFIAVNFYSLIPIIQFYLTPAPDKFKLNSEVVDSLKQNKGPYFSFIVTSDTASGLFCYEAATLKLARFMNREDRFDKCEIDFVINIGDATFRGTPFQYENYAKMREKIKFPVITAMGNHDDDLDNGAKGLELFKKYCGEKDLSFADRNAYFIILDDIDGKFSDKQFAYFEEELKKASAYDHTFVFMHKPPFNPAQESWYRIETCPWSYKFMKLCEKYKVDMVFSGHEYVQTEADFGGVKYVTACGGGTLPNIPSWEGAGLNYLVVKVNGDYVSYETRKIPPPAWVYFTYYLWVDIAYHLRNLYLQ